MQLEIINPDHATLIQAVSDVFGMPPEVVLRELLEGGIMLSVTAHMDDEKFLALKKLMDDSPEMQRLSKFMYESWKKGA